MLLVKAHYFCLDKRASEAKQPELSTSISNRSVCSDFFFCFFSDQSQNKLFHKCSPTSFKLAYGTHVKSVLILLTQTRRSCREIGSISFYGHS